MKLKKLIDRINEIGDLDLIARRKKSSQLKKTLKKLKKKQAELLENYQSETDSLRRESLENKIRIIKAQRKKGVALRKELKKATEEGVSQKTHKQDVV